MGQQGKVVLWHVESWLVGFAGGAVTAIAILAVEPKHYGSVSGVVTILCAISSASVWWRMAMMRCTCEADNVVVHGFFSSRDVRAADLEAIEIAIRIGQQVPVLFVRDGRPVPIWALAIYRYPWLRYQQTRLYREVAFLRDRYGLHAKGCS